MTSMYGSDPGWMLTFTKEIKDLRKPNPGLQSDEYTIAGLLQHNPDFSLFNFIVKRAKLEYILNSYDTNLTLLVPSDTYLKALYPEWFFVSMDYLAAKDFVQSHLLNRKVTLEMLMSSEGMRLPTHHRTGRFKSIYCSYTPRINKININNNARIIEGNIMLNNGIIHVIDNFVFPPDCSNN
tara:strand:+ start:372 stop:914 length:543 start_codon:yes stop_codon:yes gene_type:complete